MLIILHTSNQLVNLHFILQLIQQHSDNKNNSKQIRNEEVVAIRVRRQKGILREDNKKSFGGDGLVATWRAIIGVWMKTAVAREWGIGAKKEKKKKDCVRIDM